MCKTMDSYFTLDLNKKIKQNLNTFLDIKIESRVKSHVQTQRSQKQKAQVFNYQNEIWGFHFRRFRMEAV